MKLTEHFSLEELIASDVAKSKRIDNTPDYESAAKLAMLAIFVLEPLRVALGTPVNVTSGYRCAKLNKAVGGAATSQHLRGEAADIQCKDLRKAYDWLTKFCDCDQVLFESNSRGVQWLHISYKSPQENRHDYRPNYQVK